MRWNGKSSCHKSPSCELDFRFLVTFLVVQWGAIVSSGMPKGRTKNDPSGRSETLVQKLWLAPRHGRTRPAVRESPPRRTLCLQTPTPRWAPYFPEPMAAPKQPQKPGPACGSPTPGVISSPVLWLTSIHVGHTRLSAVFYSTPTTDRSI